MLLKISINKARLRHYPMLLTSVSDSDVLTAIGINVEFGMSVGLGESELCVVT